MTSIRENLNSNTVIAHLEERLNCPPEFPLQFKMRSEWQEGILFYTKYKSVILYKQLFETSRSSKLAAIISNFSLRFISSSVLILLSN